MSYISEIIYRRTGYDERSNLHHTHANCHEFLLCRSGTGQMMINDRLYPLMPDALYIIDTIKVHCSIPSNGYSAGEGAVYERSVVSYESPYINALFNLTGIPGDVENMLSCFGGVCLRLDRETADFVDRQMQLLSGALADDSGCAKSSITLRTVSILERIYRGYSILDNIDQPNVTKALDYINDYIDSDVTIDSIARKVGLNKHYLCRLFKKNTNMTIIQYITGRRLSLAKEMLVTSSRSVLDIALSCGFNNVSYFCHTFMKHEGLSPTDYREKYFRKS